jgi:predicted transcriptional regulator
MNVIDSLISTIEYQEIIIWSLAKLLEEKGLITKEELLKKVSELNRKRLVYSDHED